MLVFIKNYSPNYYGVFDKICSFITIIFVEYLNKI